MLNDHRDIEGSLSEIIKFSKDLSVPDGACSTYESLYSALGDYEADLQEHVRLENDLLFPKAIKMAG